MDGLIFGIVDNGLVLAGTYCGVNVEGWLSKRIGKKANPVLGAVVGGTATNLLSDGAGCWLDPTMHGMLLGVVLGCALPMLLIPVIENIKRRFRDPDEPFDEEWF